MRRLTMSKTALQNKMKIICNTSVLAEAVINVQKAVMTKTAMPILEGILFTAEDNKVKLTGYDLEIGIETMIDADVIEEGSVIINAKIFCDIIRHIPYDKIIFETDEKLQCKIYCGDIEYFMTGISPKDYPELPVIINGKDINISQKILKDMIKKTIFSVAVNDVRVIHKGIKFEIKPGEIRLVAIDSHRIAVRKEFIDYNGEELSFVVPAKTMGEIMKLIPEGDDFIKIGLGRRHILFEINGYTIISRLLEGEFMKYESIIPTNYNTVVRTKTKDMISSVERVALFITDRFKAPLKLEFRENELKISTATALGTANEKIEVSVDGNDIEIGIQSRYILDALRAGEEEEILIGMVSPTNPVCIIPTSGEGFLYLILPVRLS
ncbi:MAG: DNA polymerase III subunit beta [Clostridia bacterium]|nr:DNA polymerase III subunit beta [Clostridia bacterium]